MDKMPANATTKITFRYFIPERSMEVNLPQLTCLNRMISFQTFVPYLYPFFPVLLSISFRFRNMKKKNAQIFIKWLDACSDIWL